MKLYIYQISRDKIPLRRNFAISNAPSSVINFEIPCYSSAILHDVLRKFFAMVLLGLKVGNDDDTIGELASSKGLVSSLTFTGR